MASYTKTVEAEAFAFTNDEKTVATTGVQAKRSNGIVLKKSSGVYFGLVPLPGGQIQKINEGDYVISASGVVQEVLSEAAFEAIYTEVEES